YLHYQKFVQFLPLRTARNFHPFFCWLGYELAVTELGSGVLYFHSLVPLRGCDFLSIRKISVLRFAFFELLTAALNFVLNLTFQYVRGIVIGLFFGSDLLLF